MLRRISPRVVGGHYDQTFRPGLRAIDEGTCHNQSRVQLGPVDSKDPQDQAGVTGFRRDRLRKRLDGRPLEERILTRRVVGHVVDDGYLGHRLADHTLDSLAECHA